MSSPYAGNPASFPTDFPIPDDTDPPTAAAVDPAFEALGDRTAYLKAALAFIASVTYASGTTTWTCPANVHLILLEWCGGGGGGGGGGLGPLTTDVSSSGAGGGGGAQLQRTWLEVTPGTQYDIVVGTGGAGGSGGAGSLTGSATDGVAGSPSRFKLHLTPFTQLAQANGGSGGRAPFFDWIGPPDDTDVLVCPGGVSGGSTADGCRPLLQLPDNAWTTFATAPGDGGDGTTRTAFLLAPGGSAGPAPIETALRNGKRSTTNQSGGSGGTKGGDDTTYRGGGPGGGGGAGAFGAGGAGGNGGNGSATTSGGSGVSGAAASANSGAGGGGGGGAGAGNYVSHAPGGNGGSGGGGFVVLRMFGSP